MSNYVIFTDSGCDISPVVLSKWGVECSYLTFKFDGEDKEYSNIEMSVTDFYARMREGGVAKTSAINIEAFKSTFEKALAQGNDILYIGFSSGLSTTFNSARVAGEELSAQYPDRKIITIDSLAASAGQGMIVYLAAEQKKKGASIEETAAYVNSIIPGLCHWFTVDDLVYLKRGGRVSPTVALVGTILNIKPVLHVDDEGHLISMSKARGRKASIAALADKYGELAVDKKNGTVFISHGDCIDDAKELQKILKDRYGASVHLITDVGTVIGAHSGPGTLALFFIGSER